MEKGVTGTTYHFGAPKFTPGCSGVRVVRSLVFCVVFCCSFFVLLSFFFFCPMCFLYFDLRIMITPLVSSNSSFLDFYIANSLKQESAGRHVAAL
jgi:hypothetical protein